MAMLLILWLFCGVISYFISKSKGYPEKDCLTQGVLGFLFGFFSLLYNLFRAPYNNETSLQAASITTLNELGKLAERRINGQVSDQEYETLITGLIEKL